MNPLTSVTKEVSDRGQNIENDTKNKIIA